MAHQNDEAPKYTRLRNPGNNERRCIARHDLGYYGCVVVAGIYEAPSQLPLPLTAEYFYPALKYCVDAQPILSAAVKDASTETPKFVRPAQLDLSRHIVLLEKPSSEDEELIIMSALENHLDSFHQHDRLLPPWSVGISQLPEKQGTTGARMLVLFSYSHSHGDGTAGLAFHKTFLRGLQGAPMAPTQESALYEPPDRPLLPSLEEAANLRISWSYLLGPLLLEYLPSYITDWLDLSPISPVTSNTWIGRPTCGDLKRLRTGLAILGIESATLKCLLSECRKHDVRLTGLLHQLIARALRETLPEHIDGPNYRKGFDLVATTPLNLRKVGGAHWTDADMALTVSAAYELFPAEATEDLWTSARRTGEQLAAASSTLADQPIGLLKYISAYRPWLTGKLGKPRDCSYELSNIMTFDPDGPTSSSSLAGSTDALQAEWDVGKMYFSQPADVNGPPLTFSVVSKKGGDLTICLSWQASLSSEESLLGVTDEQRFTKDLTRNIRSQVDAFAEGKKS